MFILQSYLLSVGSLPRDFLHGSIRVIKDSLAESYSVYFLQKYQVTLVFAVPICKKPPKFYGSVAARQMPVAYSNVKNEEKGLSL